MFIKKLTVVVLFFTMLMPNVAFAVDNYATWAEPYVRQASELGLLTESVMKDYVRALTREEFCELVVNMYEKRVGSSITSSANPFTDTSNPMIIKAYSIGIVNGTSAATFSPTNSVTREQAAIMLVNTIRKMEELRGVQIYTGYTDTLPFQDSDQISSWALDAMKVAYANGLMAGDGTNVRPLANISCQECIILVINAYNREEILPQDVGNSLRSSTSGISNTATAQSATVTQAQSSVQNTPSTQPSTVPQDPSNPAITLSTPGAQGNQTSSASTQSGTVKVVIDGGNIPLKINETTQLSYSLSNSDVVATEIIWTSSANNVATVDQKGTVKAIGKGSTKITLKMTVNGKSISATKPINVDPPVVALNSVTIANPVRAIKYGDSSTFNVQLSPSTATVQNVEWSSSNTKVATIDAKGKATSTGAGTATIKIVVTAKDGTKKEATATLTVTAAIAITSIKFGSTSSEPLFVGNSRTVSATISPSGAIANSKTWSSSNPSVASINSSGKISAISEGTTVITLETVDRTGAIFTENFILAVKSNYVSSFKLEKSTYNINIGETIYPELILSPSNAVVKTVTFSFSSNVSGIVSTNNTTRSVTGKKEGSGVLSVKVTFEDKTTHTAQATVNVLPNAVESVSLVASRSVLKKTGETTSVKYTISPKDASYKSITFSSSDESVATVANSSSVSASGSRTVRAVDFGECVIKMTIQFSDGSTRSESVSIAVL